MNWERTDRNIARFDRAVIWACAIMFAVLILVWVGTSLGAESSYKDGVEQSIKSGQSLVVIVGKVKAITDLPGMIVANVDTLEGYKDGDIVVATPDGGKLYWTRTCRTLEEVKQQPGDDALDEVNTARAARGLKLYLRDEGLTVAARGAAKFRAANLISGHTDNDFKFLPSGTSSPTAGCAMWAPGDGWGSCATYENWTYAGAAWAIGSNGQRFMHLFVR